MIAVLPATAGAIHALSEFMSEAHSATPVAHSVRAVPASVGPECHSVEACDTQAWHLLKTLRQHFAKNALVAVLATILSSSPFLQGGANGEW